MTINASNPLTASGLLKISAVELAYLKSYLDRGDRGGYYMALPDYVSKPDLPIIDRAGQGRVRVSA